MNIVLLFKIWECQKRSKPKKIISTTISVYIVVVLYILLVQSLTRLRSHKLSAVDKDDYEYWQYL
jgi:uncharacterized membrane protein